MPTLTGPGWAEHARTVLSQSGHHKGAARDAIIELLAGERCALSALEIEDQLRGGERHVARASIYRVLELLQEHSWWPDWSWATRRPLRDDRSRRAYTITT